MCSCSLKKNGLQPHSHQNEGANEWLLSHVAATVAETVAATVAATAAATVAATVTVTVGAAVAATVWYVFAVSESVLVHFTSSFANS